MNFSVCEVLKKNKVFIILLLAAVTGVSSAFCTNLNNVELSQKGQLHLRAYRDTTENSAYEYPHSFDNIFDLENKFDLKKWDAILQLNAQARYKVVTGEWTENEFDVSLQEAFIEFRHDNYSFSFGNQIFTWGKLDDVVILDQINPQDLTDFILFDKQQRKVPVLSAQYIYYGDGFQIETVYMPFFQPSDLRYFDSDWAVFGHIRRVVSDSSAYSASLKNIVSNIRVEDSNRYSHHSFKNGQFALRFRSRKDEIDYALYYFTMYNRLPELREKNSTGNTLKNFLYVPTVSNLTALSALSPSNSDLILTKEYKRMHAAGFDFETVIGAFGFRGEASFFSNMPFLRRDFSYVTKNLIACGLGVDYTTSKNWYWNVQFIEKLILDYEDMFNQEKMMHLLTASLSKSFLRGNLLFDFDFGYSLSQSDSVINPEFTYKFSNGLDLSLGGFSFNGDATTTFGRYDTKDLVYLECLYSF